MTYNPVNTIGVASSNEVKGVRVWQQRSTLAAQSVYTTSSIAYATSASLRT